MIMLDHKTHTNLIAIANEINKKKLSKLCINLRPPISTSTFTSKESTTCLNVHNLEEEKIFLPYVYVSTLVLRIIPLSTLTSVRTWCEESNLQGYYHHAKKFTNHSSQRQGKTWHSHVFMVSWYYYLPYPNCSWSNYSNGVFIGFGHLVTYVQPIHLHRTITNFMSISFSVFEVFSKR